MTQEARKTGERSSQRSVCRAVPARRERPASAVKGHGGQLLWGCRCRGDALICMDSVTAVTDEEQQVLHSRVNLEQTSLVHGFWLIHSDGLGC